MSKVKVKGEGLKLDLEGQIKKEAAEVIVKDYLKAMEGKMVNIKSIVNTEHSEDEPSLDEQFAISTPFLIRNVQYLPKQTLYLYGDGKDTVILSLANLEKYEFTSRGILITTSFRKTHYDLYIESRQD